jgi:hypothetical protein
MWLFIWILLAVLNGYSAVASWPQPFAVINLAFFGWSVYRVWGIVASKLKK